MMNKNLTGFLLAALLVSAPVAMMAGDSASTPSTGAAAEIQEAEYTKKLDARVAPIVASLGVDHDKAAHLHSLIVAQYRAVNAWHAEHDIRLKELAVVSGGDAEKLAAAKREIGELKASLKSLHRRFVASLGADLGPEQIERVKDGMTVGKVQFTYGGYLQQNPDLTDQQKAKILTLLKDAREEAMDAGSMDEKSAIFNQYKGKINNYLASQGVGHGKSKTGKSGETDTSSK